LAHQELHDWFAVFVQPYLVEDPLNIEVGAVIDEVLRVGNGGNIDRLPTFLGQPLAGEQKRSSVRVPLIGNGFFASKECFVDGNARMTNVASVFFRKHKSLKQYGLHVPQVFAASLPDFFVLVKLEIFANIPLWLKTPT
jgi:hypothetical protein